MDINTKPAADKEHEVELRYRSLFEQSPDGILIIDPTGAFMDFNHAAHAMLGYSREEFSRLRISDISTDGAEHIRACIGRLLANGKAEFEVRYRAKDGSIRDVQVISRVISSSGTTYFHSLWQDITERKQVQNAYRETMEQYRTLFEAFPDAIVMADTETGMILDVNPAACDLLGRSREDIIGLHQTALHPFRSRDSTRRNFQAHVAETKHQGKTHLTENAVVRPDGTEIPVEILAQTVPVRGKQVLLGVFRNIAERKRAENELEKSEAFIQNILESVDESFIVIGKDHRILSANSAYLASMNRTREEVIGRPCYEISHGKFRPCFEEGEECPVRRTFETGRPVSASHVHQDRGGAPLYMEIKTYPLNDASGRVSSVIQVLNDVTDKKKLEDQLRHAQKMEAVGQFAGGIAHDFNNILTAIIGYASLMKTKMDDADPQKHNMRQILDAAERAAELTRGLLSFSRKQVINPQPADMNAVVANVEKLLLRIMDESVHVEVRYSDLNVTVKADVGQVQQILMNLATNAKDAMPSGGTFTITIEPCELGLEFIRANGFGKPGSYVLVTAADSGNGMDEKTRQSVFEPFFTTKEVGKGTGLGLSIVYGIVKQHNGYITCESRPGNGSAFRIYLPAFKGRAAGVETMPVPEARGGQETVLIGEDDGAVRNLIRQVLIDKGYRVIEASDGDEAIGKFRANSGSIDLLILDVMMPKKNGKQAYEEIRKEHPSIKTIFISGYTADVMHKKGTLDEGVNFIAKPIRSEELLVKMRELLD